MNVPVWNSPALPLTASVTLQPLAPALAAATPLPAPMPAADTVPAVSTAAPTQEAARGLRFDFNDGCRVTLPQSVHPWKVGISDLDTGNILFETEIAAGSINSSKRYYVRFRLEVWQQGDSVLVHDYCAADREVLVRFPVETLGDPLGWFPYAVKFKERHGCRLICAMSKKLIELLRDAYPDITFITEEEIDPQRYYASYTIAVYFQQGAVYDHKDCVPCEFRHVGLHRAAGYILGVDPTETPPRIAIPDRSRPVAEPYVCIGVQSTLQAKYWNNPTGWREIVASSGHICRRGLKTKQGTSPLPSVRAGSSMPIFSSAFPADWPGSPGQSELRW